jgi:molecular chaperone GrpE (heat shock protein)
MNKRIAAKKAKQEAGTAGLSTQLDGLVRAVPAIRHAVEEVAEDNVALMQTLTRAVEGQDALRGVLLQEIRQLRSDVGDEIAAQLLKGYCRELSPVLNALEAMLGMADFSDGATIRQHVESVASTLQAALGRMGIERIPIAVGTDLFNENVHDCVRACGTSDSPLPEAASRIIVRVQEPGYRVRGRIAVPAKVWVQKIEAEREANA